MRIFANGYFWRIHRDAPLFSERHGYERVFRIGKTAFQVNQNGKNVYFWCAIIGHEWNATAISGYGGHVTEQTCRRCWEKCRIV